VYFDISETFYSSTHPLISGCMPMTEACVRPIGMVISISTRGYFTQITH